MVFPEDHGEDLPWSLQDMLGYNDVLPVGRMRDCWESEDEDFGPADKTARFDIDPDTCLTEMATSEAANPEMVAPRTSFTTGRISERTCRISGRMSERTGRMSGVDPTSSNRSSFRRSFRGMGSFRMRISQQHLLSDQENSLDHASPFRARDEADPVVAGASSILRSILRNRSDERRLPDVFDFHSREPLNRNDLYQTANADFTMNIDEEDEPFPDDFLMGDFNGEYPTLLSHVSTRIHSANSLYSDMSSNRTWLGDGSLLEDDNADVKPLSGADVQGADGKMRSVSSVPSDFGDKVL